MNGSVYLDCNATTRPTPAVIEAMNAALRDGWGNPSSMHEPGQRAKHALGSARERVAGFIGCRPAELIFTSGATEANHTAILGALAAGARRGRNRIVLSAVEHPALLALVSHLEARGTPVSRIPVAPGGRVDADAARAMMGDDVALVSVMGANNETGVRMPVERLADMAHSAGALMHVDATQLAGKSTARFETEEADLWSLSAHKLHGPKGVGALVMRKGVELPVLLHGRQERRRRGGTENTAGIAGFAAAAEEGSQAIAEDIAHMRRLQARLEAGLMAALPGVHVYSRAEERLPNTTCARFGTLDAEEVLAKLERHGVIASSGAACSAAGTEPSHVLLAMGEPARLAKCAVRFSTDRFTTHHDIDVAIAAATLALAPLLSREPERTR